MSDWQNVVIGILVILVVIVSPTIIALFLIKDPSDSSKDPLSVSVNHPISLRNRSEEFVVHKNIEKTDLEKKLYKIGEKAGPYLWLGTLLLVCGLVFGPHIYSFFEESVSYILIVLFTLICSGIEKLFVPISVIYAIKKMIVEPILKKR